MLVLISWAELVSRVLDTHLSIPDWDVNDDFLAPRGDGRAVDRYAVHPLLVAGDPHCRGFGQPGRKQEVILLKVLILANRNRATVESSRTGVFQPVPQGPPALHVLDVSLLHHT